MPRAPLIGGGGKIPDMIWLANWGFGGGFKIIANKRPPGFMTAGPFFRSGIQERPNRLHRLQPPGAVPPVP